MSNVRHSKYNLDIVYTGLILLFNQGMYEYKVHRKMYQNSISYLHNLAGRHIFHISTKINEYK